MTTEPLTQFDYLLNAFEPASQADKPAEHGYAEKRRVLFAYVRETERAARNRDMWKGQCERQADELERLRAALAQPNQKNDPNAPDVRLLQEQAAAWLLVVDTLTEVAEWWHDLDGSGMDMAAKAIRQLAAQVAPAGYKLMAVKGFDELIQALDRADSKGYMPDAMADEWAAFNWQAAAPAQPAPSTHPQDASKSGAGIDTLPAQQADCPYYIAGPDIAKGAYSVAEVATGRIVARIPAEHAPSLTVEAEPRPPSPTAGMTLAQRILHVGGRNNAAGYVEFGSTQAVEALVRQVLRDLPTAATAHHPAQGVGLPALPEPAARGTHYPDGFPAAMGAYTADQMRAYARAAIAQAPAAEPPSDVVFSYSGRIYVRCCGRGISLEDKPDDYPQLEDALPEGRLLAEISIRKPPTA